MTRLVGGRVRLKAGYPDQLRLNGRGDRRCFRSHAIEALRGEQKNAPGSNKIRKVLEWITKKGERRICKTGKNGRQNAAADDAEGVLFPSISS